MAPDSGLENTWRRQRFLTPVLCPVCPLFLAARAKRAIWFLSWIRHSWEQAKSQDGFRSDAMWRAGEKVIWPGHQQLRMDRLFLFSSSQRAVTRFFSYRKGVIMWPKPCLLRRLHSESDRPEKENGP